MAIWSFSTRGHPLSGPVLSSLEVACVQLSSYSCLRTAVCSCSNPSQWSVLRPSQHLPSHIQPRLPHLVWHQWSRPCLVLHCWLLLSLPQLVWYCRYRQRLPRLVWHCRHLPTLPCPVEQCQYSKPATPGLAPPARPGTPTPAPPAPATPGPALPAPAKLPKGFCLYSCHPPAKLLEKFHHLRQSLERCHWPRGRPPELLLLCLLDSLLLVFVLDSVISNWLWEIALSVHNKHARLLKLNLQDYQNM